MSVVSLDSPRRGNAAQVEEFIRMHQQCTEKVVDLDYVCPVMQHCRHRTSPWQESWWELAFPPVRL